MKKGNIYSLSSYWTVESVESNGKIVLVDNGGRKAETNKNTLKDAFVSGDEYSKEEEVTKTDLNNLILATKNTAMTVNFNKVDKPKSKKAFEAEKKIKVDEITSAPASKVANLLMDLMDNPILNYTPGENRTIRGYHTSGILDSNGYLHFIDMEEKDSSNNYISKQVNTRNVCWAIINGVKYTVK